jgi:hypothetical protein
MYFEMALAVLIAAQLGSGFKGSAAQALGL